MGSAAACKCGTIKEQIDSWARNNILPLYLHPNGARGLSDVDKSLVIWLTKTGSVI